MGLLKKPFYADCRNLLAAGVFGDSFGAFGDSMLGQFTREKETNRGLDFPRRDGRLLVLESETRSFRCNSLENVVDERVHDAHGFG